VRIKKPGISGGFRRQGGAQACFGAGAAHASDELLDWGRSGSEGWPMARVGEEGKGKSGSAALDEKSV